MCVVVVFFYLTIQIATFCLCGWCVLGVFIAGIHPSGKYQDLFESMRWNACVHRLDLSLHSHRTVLENGVRNRVNSNGKMIVFVVCVCVYIYIRERERGNVCVRMCVCVCVCYTINPRPNTATPRRLANQQL